MHRNAILATSAAGVIVGLGVLARVCPEFKAAYLDDDQIDDVIAHALRIRHRPAG